MLYNNLIYLLLVILIMVTRGAPEAPQLPPLAALALFTGKALVLLALNHRAFRRPGPATAGAYFRLEQRFSILAIVSLAIDVYLLDLHYYLAQLPGTTALPALLHFAGLALFIFYLLLFWERARPAYGRIFGARHRPLAFIGANLKLNLVILLPWLLITLLADLLALSRLAPIQRLLASPWGEPLLILGFFLVLLLLFPLLATRLWGCQPLPDSPLRRRLEEFCRRHGVKFREIMSWPLFEGRLLTAGVMGLSGRFRYLLLTPALINALDDEELEAVVAHEIGHVRHYHLPLYLLFFLGFGLLAHLAATPFLILLLNSHLLDTLIAVSGQSPLTIINIAGTIALVLLLVLYFRFLFGFFMRNFERQADLFALSAMGRAAPLLRVFDKIARLGGQIRDLPSWHHFSIGQRMAFLSAGEANPRLVGHHHRKVRLALAAFLLLLGAAAATLGLLPPQISEQDASLRLAETMLIEQRRAEPDNPQWPRYLGDLYYFRHQYREAINHYRDSLALEAEQPEVLNNLAWLLLTAEDEKYRDPRQARELAHQAVALRPDQAHILDTLATAYWRLGEYRQAVKWGEAALAAAPDDNHHYRQQLEKFRRALRQHREEP
ncbi:MAG: M48 family metalloprotease [Desulfurivibrio sp.]|nr:M48 family metalloprotease [Desulfurivibrio sp.]